MVRGGRKRGDVVLCVVCEVPNCRRKLSSRTLNARDRNNIPVEEPG